MVLHINNTNNRLAQSKGTPLYGYHIQGCIQQRGCSSSDTIVFNPVSILEGGIEITSFEDCSGLLNQNVTSVVAEYKNCYYTSPLMITNYDYLQYIVFGLYCFMNVNYLQISNNSVLQSIRFLDKHNYYYNTDMEVVIKGLN